MTLACPRCARSNPDDAQYCYHDGICLVGGQASGALNLAQVPFATPFCFASGDACCNFDQFALGCHAHWDETWTLLNDELLKLFLAHNGRLDLCRVADEARAHTDPDQGVDYFLAHLPAVNLLPPTLRVRPERQDFGALRPGQDLAFDLELCNDGHRLIVGHVSAECPWLQVEGAAPGQPLLVQFSQGQTVRVHVVGRLLTAGVQERVGRLLVYTNGGEQTIEVACTVPVVPFPDGIFGGCLSPREVAKRARQFPEEAAYLFGDGTVAAWYHANGWTYPVDEAPATGKAAVQQFFEALGLTTPPRVWLDTEGVQLCGAPGELVQTRIQVHSDERRPVFAIGRSATPWLRVVGNTAFGNRATVTIEANVPDSTLATLTTDLELRCNGTQRFRVPVVLTIDRSAPHLQLRAPAAQDAAIARRPLRLVAAVLLGAALLSFASLLWKSRGTSLERSPVKAYAAALPEDTCAVFEADLKGLAQAGFGTDVNRLCDQFSNWVRDLNVKERPERVFVALTPKGEVVSVWTFEQRLSWDGIPSQRYTLKHHHIAVDNADRTLAWTVDREGRLVGGPEHYLHGMRKRQAVGRVSDGCAAIGAAAADIPADALAWAAGDLQACRPQVLTALRWPDGPAPALQNFHLELVRETRGLRVRGSGTFTDPGAALQGQEAVAMLTGGAIPLLPALDVGQLLAGQQPWHADGNDLTLDAQLRADALSNIVRLAADALAQRHLARKKAVAAYEYESALKDIEADRAAGRLDQAQRAVARLKKNPLADGRLTELAQKVATQAKRGDVDRIINGTRSLTARDQIDVLCERFAKATAVDPDDPRVKDGTAAAQQLSIADAALQRAQKVLRDTGADDASAQLSTAANALTHEALTAHAPEEPFKTLRALLVNDTLAACKKVCRAQQDAAEQAQQTADELLTQHKPAEAETAYAETRDRLRRAQDTLEVQRRLDGKAEALLAAMKGKATDIEEAGRNARAARLRADGRRELDGVRAALKTAMDDPATVRPAQQSVRAAQKSFTEANDLHPDDQADPTEDANKLWQELDRFLRPITLEPQAGMKRLPSDQWEKYAWQEWALRPVERGHCLRAEAALGTLQSTSCPWPVEFVLNMEFSVVDGSGRIRNSLFNTNPNPLAVILLGDRGENIRIAVGWDARAKTLGDEARVFFGTGPSYRFNLERNAGLSQPIRLTLRAAKGQKGSTLRLTVNDQFIGSVSATGRFRKLRLVATRPKTGVEPWFVAIHRLDVHWVGLDDPKQR
jgi:hypothetical protein